MSKLLVTYLKQTNKSEVLELIARILNWTEEEKKEIGMLSKPGSWGLSLFGSRDSKSSDAKEREKVSPFQNVR